MHTSNRFFKIFCVGVVLSTILMLSPQNVSGKPVNLGNVTGDIIQVTGKIWQTLSHISIDLDFLKSIKFYLS